MSTSTGPVAITASFGSVTVVVSDSYIVAAPAEAVIVSANSHLKTATSGAHNVTRVAGADYKQACVALLQGHVDGLPQGTAWLTGDQVQEFPLTAGKRKVIQAIRSDDRPDGPDAVTEQVVAHATASVINIRTPEAATVQPRHVLVPVDATPSSAMALSSAVDLARGVGASVTLLDTVAPTPGPLIAGLGMRTMYVDPAWDQAAAEAGRTYVDRIAARLRKQGLRADGRVAVGEPSESITRVANEIGDCLIVMSTHAARESEGSAIGELAREVVATARQPVLLVRGCSASALARFRAAASLTRHALASRPAA